MKVFDPTLFTSRLTELRKEKKLTQLQMAENLPVSRTGYSSWEQGKSKPDLDNFFKLCLFFNVSADYLLGLSDISNKTQVNILPTTTLRNPLDNLLPEYRQQAETYLAFLRQQQAAQLSAGKEEA